MKIGIGLTSMQNPESGVTPSYTEIREIAQAAEASGMDSIWFFDHLLFRFEPEKTQGIWECWTLLSALAECTNRVELGTLVLCNPFRNPALLAKMAHTVDEISNGRLILGVGAGWHEPEFDAFGYSFARRVDRFEEALQILLPLLRGETVNFAGNHYQAKDCVITPPGPRPDGIPLLIGAGQPRMLRLTARYADMWNTAWLGESAGLTERLEKLHSACADVGRDPATMGITVGVSPIFPELGASGAWAQNPITGSPAELAQALQKYADMGVAHIILQLAPFNLTAVERAAEAVRLYRGHQ